MITNGTRRRKKKPADQLWKTNSCLMLVGMWLFMYSGFSFDTKNKNKIEEVTLAHPTKTTKANNQRKKNQ